MDKITLPISELREFISLSKFIETIDSEVMPILKYIHVEIVFGTCILTKTNNFSFIRHKFDTDQDDCSFVIEEKKLEIICSSTELFVTFTIEENCIITSYGKVRQKNNVKYVSASDFPKIPSENTNVFRINKEILSSFGIAKTYSGGDSLLPAFSSIYSKDNNIFSTDRQIFYCRQFSETIPEMSITRSECSLISSFEYIDFSVSENYNTYKTGNTTYGFIQPEGANPFDYRFLTNKVTKSNYITIKTNEFVKFCESVSKFKVGKFCNSSFSVISQNTLELKYEDLERGEEYITECTGLLIGEQFKFEFNPLTWLPVFKTISYSEISIGNEGNAISLFNRSDEKYIGIVSKLS